MGAHNLRPWQPGQSGNPSGRPKIPEHLRSIASLSQGEVCKLVSKYARMTRDELQQAIQAPSTPVLEMAIASIFAQSIKQGDYTRLAFLLDRAIGKVPQVILSDEQEQKAALSELPRADLLQIIKSELEKEVK